MEIGSYLKDIGLDSILAVPDEDFSQYVDMVRGQVTDAIATPEMKMSIVRSLDNTLNNYLLKEEVKTEREKFVQSLALYSKEKQTFLTDIFDIIFNTILEVCDTGELYKEVTLHFQKLHEDARVPEIKHKDDSGYDMYTVEEVTIPAFGTAMIGIGLAVAVPHGWQLNAYLRSGIGLNTPLFLKNGVGIIDGGYRGEIKAIIGNMSNEPYTIEKGTRIMQCELNPSYHIDWLETEDITSIGEDRNGGMGSTGVK